MWRRLLPSILLILHACSSGGGGGGTTSTPLPQWSSLRHDIGNSAVGSGALDVNGGVPRLLIEGGITSTPAVALDGQLYAGTLTGLVAIEEEGGERWRFEMCESTARATSTLAQERCIGKPVGPVVASPAVTAGDDVVIVAASGCVFDVSDDGPGLRTCRWAAVLGVERCELSEAESCAASSPQVIIDSRDLSLLSVYVGSRDGGLVALNGNGTLRWRFPLDGSSLGGPFTSSPAIGLETIYVATPSGFLYSLDGAGRPIFGVPILLDPNAVGLQPSPASATAAYLPNAGGRAVAYNPDGTVKWRFSSNSSSDVVGSLGVASQLVQEPDSTASTFEPITYLLDEAGELFGLRDTTGDIIELPRCSISNDVCTIDSCPEGEGPCVDGKCSGTLDDVNCTVQNCATENGTCVVKNGRVRIVPEGIRATTSPSISGDLFAVVGTETGSVCARRLDDQTPDSWPEDGCIALGSDLPIQDSPVIDSRGRVFLVSNASLYAIE